MWCDLPLLNSLQTKSRATRKPGRVKVAVLSDVCMGSYNPLSNKKQVLEYLKWREALRNRLAEFFITGDLVSLNKKGGSK